MLVFRKVDIIKNMAQDWKLKVLGDKSSWLSSDTNFGLMQVTSRVHSRQPPL